jgi:hypothetical protein
LFEVTSKHLDKNNKVKEVNVYAVDLRGPLCNCKAFFYNKKRGKTLTCAHITATIQILRAGGNKVIYNPKDKTHTVI